MDRKTHQKRMVLETLKALKGKHPTALEVYEQVVLSIPTISKATVYRILGQATDVVQRLQIPSSAERYDDRLGRHHHMRCDQCAQIFDLDLPGVDDAVHKLCGSLDFEVTGHAIFFRGICPRCKAEDESGG